MNSNRVRDIIVKFDEILSADTPDNEEYLVVIANLLIAFGRNGLSADGDLENMNIEDSTEIEFALSQLPDNPYLASVLQGHAIIKWSEYFKG